MKKILFILGLMIATHTAFAQNRLGPSSIFDPPGWGESEITIEGTDADHDLAVYVDGQLVLHMPPNTRGRALVPDGGHIITVATTEYSRRKGWEEKARKSITVKSQANSITIEAFTIRWGLRDLKLLSTRALPEGLQGSARPAASTATSAPAARSSGADGIEDALYRASNVLMEKLTFGTTIAIINVSSRDRDMAEFVIEELAYVFVDTGNYKVVDRKSLDAIRSEQNFQTSGEVDDDSAVSIGKLLGANVVITGSISGADSTRRLRLKALDVRTAEILAMASERF